MTRITVYDACVLYPAPLRDLLVRLARAYLFQAKWTKQIHAEWIRNVLRDLTDLTSARLARTRDLMNRAIPDCLVTGYEEIVPTLQLRDPDDRHVLAAAIRCHANVIVTFYRRDFPTRILEPYGVEAQSPDDFVEQLIELHAATVFRVLGEQRAALRNPEVSTEELLATLEQQGLTRCVSKLRETPDLI